MSVSSGINPKSAKSWLNKGLPEQSELGGRQQAFVVFIGMLFERNYHGKFGDRWQERLMPIANKESGTNGFLVYAGFDHAVIMADHSAL